MLRSIEQFTLQTRTFALVALLAISTTAPANAVEADEILEKAIYTEESVGNLDGAIDLYRQVIEKQQGSINAAAEAQYRIGICLEKQGKKTEAEAAFQKVVDSYPTAQEWIAKAKSRLPGTPALLAAPWGNGEETIMEMKLPNGMPIGQQVYRVIAGEENGKPVWICDAWQTIALNDQQGNSQVIADKESYAPIRSTWEHSMLGKSSANYTDKSVTIEISGRDDSVTIDYTEPVFDNEQVAVMFRRLPLEVGYEAQINIIPILTGVQVPLGLEVTKIETVKTPVGEFECFRLELSIKQTFWISTDERRQLVKFEAGGVYAELTEVNKVEPGETKIFENDSCKLTLPENWYTYRPSNTVASDPGKVYLSPSSTAVRGRVDGGELDSIQKDHGTPQAWVESAVQHYRDRLGDIEILSQGVESKKYGEHDGAFVIFKYEEGGTEKIAYRVGVFGNESAANIRFTVTASEFDQTRPELDSIIDSFHVK